ncbi:hypothetical protein SARI_01364 [Salmonella enterica subsp. arizonae serovar 62:z4,z23:-]|uniref:Uncharacterized protein n=1 Tax=Salmonella arizonae (strain ATCC BAA-731 / CDC346-86 / RSK2980) TaxID=41514 RepID=A9MQW9_SALAR|nr:hypothetical protein SARI_01364 [Salmonella enterica subsp. arizonae serovar 62:z4,z23:-]
MVNGNTIFVRSHLQHPQQTRRRNKPCQRTASVIVQAGDADAVVDQHIRVILQVRRVAGWGDINPYRQIGPPTRSKRKKPEGSILRTIKPTSSICAKNYQAKSVRFVAAITGDEVA